MMSKAPRWPETLVNTKTSKPALKKGGKDQAALTFPLSSRSKQAGSSEPSGTSGRSISSRSNDPGAKARGSLKRGVVSGHQGARQTAQSARAALRLCSSQSFSSLHTSSLTAAPFTRNSRSLTRLDQRSIKDDFDCLKGQTSKRKVLSCSQLTSSNQEIRDRRASESLHLSSASVSTTASLNKCNNVKKQTKDGANTFCAMTSGIRRNWVQTVFKNVRPSLAPDVTSFPLEQKTDAVCEADPQSAEHTHQQDKEEQEFRLELETEKSFADRSSASSSHRSSNTSSSISCSPINPPQQADEEHCQSPVLVGTTQTDVPLCDDGAASPLLLLNDKHSNVQGQTTTISEELHVSNSTARDMEPCEQQTDKHSKETDLSNSGGSSDQQLSFQRLQKINRDLRQELEEQRRSQEEAREAELRRRVDLLAQQAQLLVTGDATALAQAHLQQDRRRFHEQKMEWESCVASLKSQLSISEEQRKGAESDLATLQQRLQGYEDLQQEADQLRKQLQEVSCQLRSSEDAQGQKEARLQKHLVLLQASQDRERRSLTVRLAQAEQHSQYLQERLEEAEQQVESLNKTQTWNREIQEAQKQLQEELACTVSAVQRLQEDREQLERRCEELQSQLSEAAGEVSRLQSRLKTEETSYYDLEHSFEKVSEELQLSVGKVKQRESETQEMREGYERLLDQKEQELSEVLLKMEVLGISLEETEGKLNEALRACSCGSSQTGVESSEPEQNYELPDEPSKALDHSHCSNDSDVPINGDPSPARPRSLSAGPSYQYIVTEDDSPERFMSIIQMLETKLFMTEEKLKDITQTLEEHQGHVNCQDPHLYSQLTQSRATTQHLGLLLHSQAKQSRRFAQETEAQLGVLVGRFQVALNIVQTCRERLQVRRTGASAVDMTEFERQLASMAVCLQNGQRDAEKQRCESHRARKGDERILNKETIAGPERDMNATIPLTNAVSSEEVNVRKYLMRELAVVEKMVYVLQSPHGVGQLPSVPKEDKGDVVQRYKVLISQMLAIKKTQPGSTQSAIGSVCAEAELIHAAFRLQQQHNCQRDLQEHQRECLADVHPPELAPYEQEAKGGEGAVEPSDEDKAEVEKMTLWLERLVSRLQNRAEFLSHLCQVSEGDRSVCDTDDNWGADSSADLNWMQEQAKLIYLSYRLYFDLEQELQRREVLQDKLQLLCKQQGVSLVDRQAFNTSLCELQEDNSTLREELQRAEQKIETVDTEKQRLLEDIQKTEDYHEEQVQNLEAEFQKKISELQQIHEEEMKHLHDRHMKYCVTKDKDGKCTSSSRADLTDLENCRGPDVTAMEKMHTRLIEELQQQHEKQLEELLKEKDKQLKEETAATMTAIVAMRRAHKVELERSRRSQRVTEDAGVAQLHSEYQNEIQLLQKELEVLSLQYTQKCLENSHLRQELEDDDRKWSMQHLRGCQTFTTKQDQVRTQNKLKTLYTNSQDDFQQEANKVRDHFKFATWSPARDAPGLTPEDAVTNKRSAASLWKKDKSSLTRQIRVVRSQSLKDGLSVQERMKLFESW